MIPGHEWPNRFSEGKDMIRSQRYGLFLFVILAAGCAHCVDYTPGFIVLPAAQAGNAGLQYAAQVLAGAMGELYATAPAVISDADFQMPRDGRGLVVVGTTNRLANEFDLGVYLPREKLRTGSHGITPADAPGDSPVLFVYGQGIQGEMFGLTYLAERLRLDPSRVHDVTALRTPFFPIRIMSGDPVEKAVQLGYNTVFTPLSHNNVVLLEDYDPEFFFQHEKERNSVLQRPTQYAEALAAQQAMNLDSISSADEFEFHKALLKRPYTAELTRGGADWICFCAQKVWDVYRAKYQEILRRNRDLDAVMVRLGENYAEGDYFGNVPAKKEIWDYCEQCQGTGYTDRIATIINNTWDVVSGEHKRRTIFRTWDTHSDTFHTSPDMYREILSKIPNKHNLYFSIKYTKTDFWMYNEFNETVGVGDVPQIVEFQCQREYEGKGAFPNYIGDHAAAGYRFAADRGAAGVWNWNHGGGWNGPNLKTDIWNEANIYAAAHLAWDPKLSSEHLAREWATLAFGKEDADTMTRLLLMSDDAVRMLVYFEAYAMAKADPWMPNENWVRDDVIKGGDTLRKIYRGAPGQVPTMVAEKEKGVVLVTDMLGLAEDLTTTSQVRDPVVQTLTYELYWARVLRSYAGAFLYYCLWQDTGKESDRRLAHMHARQWKADWDTYTRETPNLTWAASLYHDDGMVDTMNSVISDLADRR